MRVCECEWVCVCVCVCVFVYIHTNPNTQGHVNEVSRPLVNLARLCPLPPPKLQKSPADQAQATASDAATLGAADGGDISNASNATNFQDSNTTRLAPANTTRQASGHTARPQDAASDNETANATHNASAKQTADGSGPGRTEGPVQVHACVARQSSESFGASPARALDGDTRRAFSALSCTHTRFQGSSNPWWSVDLGRVREVIHVRIFNRHDDVPSTAALLDNFTVHVGQHGSVADSVCAQQVRAPQWQEEEGGGTEAYLDVACRAAGRHVTISLAGADRVLSLCEVEVMGYAGRQTQASPELASTVFQAGMRQWVSLRGAWSSIQEFTERCPEKKARPEALVISWALGGAAHGYSLGANGVWQATEADLETENGLAEHEECRELSACRPGAPLLPVPAPMSACQRGQILVNFVPTIAGRYAFVLEVGGVQGRVGPWSILVAAAPTDPAKSTLTFRDLGLPRPGGGHAAEARREAALTVQARDVFGNRNHAECLRAVKGHLAYARAQSSTLHRHGGAAVGDLLQSSPAHKPFGPYAVREHVEQVPLVAGTCLRGSTRLVFTAPVSGFYHVVVSAAATEVVGSQQLVEVFPQFGSLQVGAHAPMQRHVAHSRWIYFRLHVPPEAVGFEVRTQTLAAGSSDPCGNGQTCNGDGQPWIFLQQGSLPETVRGPFPGVPQAAAAAQGCYSCRAQVLVSRTDGDSNSPGAPRKTTSLGVAGGQWYLGVFGAQVARPLPPSLLPPFHMRTQGPHVIRIPLWRG